MPGEPDAYPRRDAVAAYLEDYAAHFALPIRFGARVAAVSPIGNGGLAVRLGGGETMMAASVVAATGTFGAPPIPVIEGGSSFGGTVVHSAAYRGRPEFAGQRVNVVGRSEGRRVGKGCVRTCRTRGSP